MTNRKETLAILSATNGSKESQGQLLNLVIPLWQKSSLEKASFPLPLSQRKEPWVTLVVFSLPVVLWLSQVNKLKCSFGSDDSQGGKQQFCLQRDRARSQEMRLMFPGCTGGKGGH